MNEKMEIEGIQPLFIIVLISLMVTAITMDTSKVYIDAISGGDIEVLECSIEEYQITIRYLDIEGDKKDEELFFSIEPNPENILEFYVTFADGEKQIINISEYLKVKDLEDLVDCKKSSCTLKLHDKSTMEFFRSGDVRYVKWDNIEDTLFAIHY
jgi:hypothetical protein